MKNGYKDEKTDLTNAQTCKIKTKYFSRGHPYSLKKKPQNK